MTLQRYDRETLFFFAYHFNKNHRAIAVAWGIMSIVFCVLTVIAFGQPQWIGDTKDSPGYGHLGVYQYCVPDTLSGEYTCEGSFTSFDSILNDSFKATTVFTGLSALFMLIVVAALLTFFCFKKGYVFVICGTLELLTEGTSCTPSSKDGVVGPTGPRMDKYNVETAKIYYFRYMREYRAVCVLWAVLTIIWATLNVVVFIQPHWIGDTLESPGYGHQGVYKYCYPNHPALRYDCSGDFTDFNSILTNSYKASTFFVGVSALLMLISVAALLLFFCFKKTAVFVLVGIFELLTAIFMFLACVIYPSGWDNNELQKICGEDSGRYRMGECNIRWAYILAILGIFDAGILAILAFFLASKRAKIEMYTASGAVTKSELNGYGGETMSKRSIPITPALVTVPPDQREAYSEYSQVQKRPTNNFNL